MTSQRCSSTSNSNGCQSQLEDLRNILIKIKALTASFRLCFPGDDSRLDSFVYHVNVIFEKQRCVNIRPGGGNETLGPGLLKSLVARVGGVAGSVPTEKEELESFKAALKSIKLQVDAFQEVAEEGSDLSFLLQKVDKIIDMRSQVQSRAIRIKNKVRPQTSSASASVEVIDLEPELPDSTYFEIKTESDVATALQNRKRQSNSNVAVNSTGNTASKKAKTASKAGSVAQNTKKGASEEAKNSSTSHQALGKSEDHIESDVNFADCTFIQSNNANLGKVNLEADYNPQGHHQNNRRVITEENSNEVAFDNDDKRSDQLFPEQDQQFFEGSADLGVNAGVQESRAQVQCVALNSKIENNRDQQNSGNIFEKNKILTLIFKNLNIQDLKNVRLVNKQCKKIADARFIREKRWKLVIDYQFSERYQGKTMADLNHCIANSKGRFPLTSLIFGFRNNQGNDSRGYYVQPSLLRFYSLHGSNITSLELFYLHASVATLNDLLLKRLRKVEHISISTKSIRHTKNDYLLTSREKKLIQLPNLKTIYFSPDTHPSHKDYFLTFLTAAVNLTEIKNVNSYLLPCIAQAEKLDRIKNLILSLQNPHNDLGSFLKLSRLQPTLASLKIIANTHTSRYVEFEYIKGLNAILESSKDTLKMLQMPYFLFVPSLVLPNLKHLQLLKVYHCLPTESLGPVAIFPGHLKLREIFSNVRTLSWNLVVEVGIVKELDWISNYFFVINNSNAGEGSSGSSDFDMSRSFPSVTHLIFENYHCFGNVLEIYFPMLTQISCYKFDVIFPNGDHVGATCGLRETTIGIESLILRGFRFSGEKSRLDQLFTGISRRKCVTMNDGDKAPSTTVTGNPLLQNLKHLRRLMIVFDHLDNSKMRHFPPGPENLFNEPTASVVITPVSYLHAFALMENLKQVIFAYDHNLPAAPDFAKIFQPFAPFPRVKIVHEPNQT